MKIIKKYITILIFSLATINFSAPVDDATKILDIQQRQLEQERSRMEQQKSQEEFENTRFNDVPKIDKDSNFDDKNSKKFLINEIDIEDKDKLLSKKEKKNILKKYEYLEMGSSDIQNILVDITNKLVSKGYITSIATVSDKNDLTTGTLNLKVVAGKIEDVRINSGNGLDKYKEFFMFPKNRGKVLNIRDLDTATDNFNSIGANNMKMDIVPSSRENYSRIEVKNRLKNKYTVGILTNNYGDDKQNGIWRRGINLNIDSPLGIGDNFYFTYMTVPKKDPDRSWKKNIEDLAPEKFYQLVQLVMILQREIHCHIKDGLICLILDIR